MRIELLSKLAEEHIAAATVARREAARVPILDREPFISEANSHTLCAAVYTCTSAIVTALGAEDDDN